MRIIAVPNGRQFKRKDKKFYSFCIKRKIMCNNLIRQMERSAFIGCLHTDPVIRGLPWLLCILT